MVRPSPRIEHVGAHLSVLPGEVRTAGARRDAEELGHGGCHVHEARCTLDHSVVAHARARDDERRAGLEYPERPVLAAVAALVLPVVRGRVHHAEVGRGGVVEELGRLLERVRVGVGGPLRMRVGQLGLETGEPAG